MQSQKFLENSNSYSGDRSFSHPNLSYRTRQRLIAEQQIKKSSKNKNDIRTVVNNILTNNLPSLAAYVQYSGETPNPDPNKLIIQAALCRLNEVKTVAASFDLSDDNATLIVEDEDSEAKDMDLPGAEILPTPEVLAALKYVYDTLKQQMNTDSVGVISALNSSKPDNFQSSYSDIVDRVEDFGFNNEYYKDRDSGILPYNSFDSSLTRASNPDAVTVNNADNTGTPAPSGSIWDIIGNVVNQVAQPAATQYAIQKDFPMVLTLVMVVGLIIIGAIYANKG